MVWKVCQIPIWVGFDRCNPLVRIYSTLKTHIYIYIRSRKGTRVLSTLHFRGILCCPQNGSSAWDGWHISDEASSLLMWNVVGSYSRRNLSSWWTAITRVRGRATTWALNIWFLAVGSGCFAFFNASIDIDISWTCFTSGTTYPTELYKETQSMTGCNPLTTHTCT